MGGTPLFWASTPREFIMKYHVIGQWPRKPTNILLGRGTSLAVRQWMELVRGERAVTRPQNQVKVVLVLPEDRYCLQCLQVKTHDVIWSVGFEAGSRCRQCGKESGACLTGNPR